jgi:hypothetical protein
LVICGSAGGNDIRRFDGKSGIFRKLACSKDSFFRPQGLYLGSYLDDHHSNFRPNDAGGIRATAAVRRMKTHQKKAV